MFGEADPKIGGVFKRENGESIKMIAFSVSKQLGNIQRDCRHILGNTEPPYVSEWQRERGFSAPNWSDHVSCKLIRLKIQYQSKKCAP